MNAERWQTIKSHIDRITSEPPPGRRRLLDELGAVDPDMRAEVEELLRHEEEAESLFDEPLWTLVTTTPADPVEPDGSMLDRIGPYRLERILGQGGMGQVYLAFREDDYEQKVAVKRASGAVNRERLLARFRNERQILANLEHPLIARLLDGGTDDLDCPYLVMEYVEGLPIDQYCDQHDLDLRQRLRLFRKVCQAVHHAHQNLVVHRDLKPTNILVGTDGQPRLLDFGIAKLLEPTLDSQLTAEGQSPLTPACASPEQLMDEPVTTACDVYALGVLLYRLLSGRKPYELDGLGFAGILRRVCFQDPIPPSEAVGLDPNSLFEWDESDITDVEGLGTASIRIDEPLPLSRDQKRRRRQLQGDLDSIVMRAMRKEPRHRYASAADLADDVKNYLQGLPVTARKGNWLYQTGKHLRRNRPAVAILLLILALSMISTVLWQRAERGRAEAEQARAAAEQARSEASLARDESEAMVDFLQDMFLAADPNRNRGADMTVREVLEVGSRDIATELAGKPGVQAQLYATMGTTFSRLGLDPQACEARQAGLSAMLESDAGPSMELADFIANVGACHFKLGNFRAAEQRYREALDIRREFGAEPGLLADTLFNLASVLNQQGRYAAAEEDFLEVVGIREGVSEAKDSKLGSAYYGLATSYLFQERWQEAVHYFGRAVDLRRAAHGDEHTRVAAAFVSLAEAELGGGQVAKALAHASKGLEILSKLLGEESYQTGSARNLLARIHEAAGNLERAESESARAVAILRATRPERDWLLAFAEAVRGGVLSRLGRFTEAEELLDRSLEILEESRPSDDPKLGLARENRLALSVLAGDEERARQLRARGLGSESDSHRPRP